MFCDKGKISFKALYRSVIIRKGAKYSTAFILYTMNDLTEPVKLQYHLTAVPCIDDQHQSVIAERASHNVLRVPPTSSLKDTINVLSLPGRAIKMFFISSSWRYR